MCHVHYDPYILNMNIHKDEFISAVTTDISCHLQELRVFCSWVSAIEFVDCNELHLIAWFGNTINALKFVQSLLTALFGGKGGMQFIREFTHKGFIVAAMAARRARSHI